MGKRNTWVETAILNYLIPYPIKYLYNRIYNHQLISVLYVQKIDIPTDSPIMAKSLYFSTVVKAHSLQWNKAGRVKAIGMHAIEPNKAKKSSSLSPAIYEILMVAVTSRVLLIFSQIILLLELSLFLPYKFYSIITFATLSIIG